MGLLVLAGLHFFLGRLTKRVCDSPQTDRLFWPLRSDIQKWYSIGKFTFLEQLTCDHTDRQTRLSTIENYFFCAPYSWIYIPTVLSSNAGRMAGGPPGPKYRLREICNCSAGSSRTPKNPAMSQELPEVEVVNGATALSITTFSITITINKSWHSA